MNEVWSTKFGPRRVRHDPPVIAEAIAAAQGLSDDPAEQAEIAASLMGVPVEDVQSELKKASSRRKPITLTSTDRKGMARAVVVERRPQPYDDDGPVAAVLRPTGGTRRCAHRARGPSGADGIGPRALRPDPRKYRLGKALAPKPASCIRTSVSVTPPRGDGGLLDDIPAARRTGALRPNEPNPS